MIGVPDYPGVKPRQKKCGVCKQFGENHCAIHFPKKKVKIDGEWRMRRDPKVKCNKDNCTLIAAGGRHQESVAEVPTRRKVVRRRGTH